MTYDMLSKIIGNASFFQIANEESCPFSTCHTFSTPAAVWRWGFKSFNVYLFNSSWHGVALESVASTIGVLSLWLFFGISRAKASSNSFNQGFCWQLSYILVSVQYLLGPSGHEKKDFWRYICTLPKPRCAISYHILQLKMLPLQLATWPNPVLDVCFFSSSFS